MPGNWHKKAQRQCPWKMYTEFLLCLFLHESDEKMPFAVSARLRIIHQRTVVPAQACREKRSSAYDCDSAFVSAA